MVGLCGMVTAIDCGSGEGSSHLPILLLMTALAALGDIGLQTGPRDLTDAWDMRAHVCLLFK